MSNVHISLVRVFAVNSQGTSMPVETSQSYGTAETIASSGSSQSTTLTATAASTVDEASKYVWRIANMGTDNVYVSFADGPTATAAGKGIPAGAICFFGLQVFGHKVAVINA